MILMENKVKSIFKKLFNLVKVGNYASQQKKFPKFISDTEYIYLVSFPKSGNTWVRFLLANAMASKSKKITFQNLAEYVPDTHREQDLEIVLDIDSDFNKLPCKFVKSHAYHCTDFKKVIYLVRDGRDVLTSYYHWLNARTREIVTLSEIIKGNAPAGSWSSHVLGWLNNDCEKFLLVKYEELIEDAEKQLRKILLFANLDFESSKINRSVELSSFENLRRLEKQNGIFDGKIEAIKKVPFIRKGKRSDWENLFTKSDIDLFWSYHEKAMTKVGYV